MRVDVVGPPASGKSTLAPKLATELGAVLVELSSRRDPTGRELGDWERLLLTGRALLRHPVLAGSLLTAARHSPIALRGAVGIPRRERWMRHIGSATVVDEGPVYAVAWTVMMSRTVPNLERVARALSKPDVLVNVTADAKVMADRIVELGDRLDGSTWDQAVDAVMRYQQVNARLLAEMRVPVVEVDGAGEVDVTALALRLRSRCD